MSFFKNLLFKKTLSNQLKGMSTEQQNKIIEAVKKNPKLFEDIACEVQEKIKGGGDQQSATLEVMMAHQKELQDLMR